MQQKIQADQTLYERVRAIRGGICEISRRINVRREWVYLVLTGRGKSERVLSAAEALIAERERLQANRTN